MTHGSVPTGTQATRSSDRPRSGVGCPVGPSRSQEGCLKGQVTTAWVCLCVCHGSSCSPTGHQHCASCWIAGLRGLTGLPPMRSWMAPLVDRCVEVTRSDVVKIAMKSKHLSSVSSARQTVALCSGMGRLRPLNLAVFRQEWSPCARTNH